MYILAETAMCMGKIFLADLFDKKKKNQPNLYISRMSRSDWMAWWPIIFAMLQYIVNHV